MLVQAFGCQPALCTGLESRRALPRRFKVVVATLFCRGMAEGDIAELVDDLGGLHRPPWWDGGTTGAGERLIAILVGFSLLGLSLLTFGERLGRTAFLVAALAPAVSTVWVCARLGDVLDGRVVSEHVSWVGGLGLAIDLRLDGFAATMTLIVSAIGVLVFVYAASYFGSDTPHLGRLAGLLVLFAGAMVGLVQSDHLLLLYACWEITSVTSYLLIGNNHTDADARAAALHALLVTSAGGLAMLGGFVLLAAESGTYRLSELADGAVPGGATVTAALMTVETTREPAVIYVHFLLLNDVEGARRAVARLERLVVAALGGPPPRPEAPSLGAGPCPKSPS